MWNLSFGEILSTPADETSNTIFAILKSRTMMESIVNEMNLIEKYEIKKIIGHYQVDDKKECPSFKVPDWLAKEGFQDYMYKEDQQRIVTG